MSAWRRSGAAVRLLAVLCVTAGCAATQQQQQQPSAVSSTTTNEVLDLRARAVRLELRPVLSKLETRIDALDGRLVLLDSRMDTLDSGFVLLESRMDALDDRQQTDRPRVDAFDSRLVLLDSRVDELTVRLFEHSQNAQPDELSNRLNSQQAQLDELVAKWDGQNPQQDETTSKINSQVSRLDELDVKVGSQKSQMDGIVAEVDSQKSLLENVTTRLISQESQVAGLATKQDSLQSQLAALVSTSNSERSRLDGVANQTADLIAGLTVRPDQVEEMVNQTADLIAGLTVRLDRVEEMANQTADLIAGLTVRLDQVEEMIKSRPHDCSELPEGATTGVYALWPVAGRPVPSFCDMDTDGGNWTVFQRRDDVQPRQDFFLGWEAYKQGFGNLRKEFWWGLEHLWTMTSVHDRQYELRIDLEDFNGNKAYAVYQGFRISSEEDGYRLSASNYTGGAGDALSRYNVNSRFSTRDRDHDDWPGVSCAERCQGAWWYGDCTYSNLNGRYLESGADDWSGIWWATWKYESLKKVEMKIRPI